ncbi:hypothetical protein DFH28DRAFT_1118170 [Melampsora americana]|nr:hypothetical protein DFH28DRAFT_1118170 [Melampsora americana]
MNSSKNHHQKPCSPSNHSILPFKRLTTSKPIILLNHPSSSKPLETGNKLLNLPTQFFNSKLKSKSKSIQTHPGLDHDDGTNTLDQRSLHTAVSQIGSNYETAPSQNEPNQPQSTFNRDIWPILTNQFVYPTSDLQNDEFFHSTSTSNQNQNQNQNSNHLNNLHHSNLENQIKSDWTTSLGIDLNPTSSTSISLLKSKHQFKFNKKSNHHSHKRKSSSYKSSSVYGTYTTLARQELERERLITKHTHHHHHSNRSSASSYYHSTWNSQSKAINSSNRSNRPNTATSDTFTHSSASTNRLRKTPTSGFYPVSPVLTKRIIKKRLNKTSRQESTFTSTTQTNSTKETYQSSTFGGKLGVQLRYQNAINHHDQPSHQSQKKDGSDEISKSESSNLSTSISKDDRSNSSHHSDHSPEAGPSNWRKDKEIDQQERFDRNRTRYQHLDSPHFNLSIGKRSRKSSKRKQTQLNLPSWEYQVTQQLLIQSQSQTTRKETSKSPPSSHYHSLKSALSLDSIPSLTHLSNRMLSSPASMSGSGTGPMSTPSRVGTMVSMFSDWSKARQPSPGSPGRRGSDQSGSIHHLREHPSPLSLRNSRSKDLMSTRSSLNPLDVEFGSNYKETLISVPTDSDQEFKSPKSFRTLSNQSPKERLQQRSVSQLKREIQQEYFNRHQPNDLTHHDQAGLLLSFLPSSSSPSDSLFSPIPSLSPGLNSELDDEDEDEEEEEHDDHSSSHSWYDATDEVFILDSMDSKELDASTTKINPPSPIQPSRSVGFDLKRHSTASNKMINVKPAISAAIVFDTFSTPSNHFPSSLSQYQLLTSSPNVLPSNTIPYKKSTSQHKKTYSTPSIQHFKLTLPIPIDKLKTHGIFNSNDDPNFLSGSPSQLKKVWKKTQGRMKRAISDPSVLPAFESFKEVKAQVFKHHQFESKPKHSKEDLIEIDDQDQLREAKGKGKKKVRKFEDWNSKVKDGEEREEEEKEELQEELMNEAGLIGFDPTELQLESSSSNPIKNQHFKDLRFENHKPIENEPIRKIQSQSSLCNSNSNSNSNSSSNGTTTTHSSHQVFHSLSLVPFNGWCFVFGFICFPLWYIGSFYPQIKSTKSKPNQPIRTSTNLIRQSIEEDRFLQTRGIGVGGVGGVGGGPISGWPRRLRDESDEDGSEASWNHTQVSSYLTEEENRIPNFDLGRYPVQEIEMRTLGGFWNEIAPRIDIENALAFDGPIWAYERGRLI